MVWYVCTASGTPGTWKTIASQSTLGYQEIVSPTANTFVTNAAAGVPIVGLSIPIVAGPLPINLRAYVNNIVPLANTGCYFWIQDETGAQICVDGFNSVSSAIGTGPMTVERTMSYPVGTAKTFTVCARVTSATTASFGTFLVGVGNLKVSQG